MQFMMKDMVFRNIKLRKDGQFLGLMLIESFPALGRSWDLFECFGKAFNMNQMSWSKYNRRYSAHTTVGSADNEFVQHLLEIHYVFL